jgi:uncharacterized membrane protein YdjX (TVP38/TMEM64 family)
VNAKRWRWLLGLGLAALLLHAWAAGWFSQLDGPSVEQRIRDAGAWGPVLYVVLFMLLEPFGVPGIVFVVPGGLVWSWPTLFVLSWVGATGAGVCGFTFARTIGRDWVERRLSDRARAYDQALAENGLRTVIVIRLLFFIAPWAHWLLGLSRVRFRDFLLGTVLGLAPMMALFTWAGGNAVAWFSERPVLAALGFAAVVVAIAIGARRFHAAMESTVYEPAASKRNTQSG